MQRQQKHALAVAVALGALLAAPVAAQGPVRPGSMAGMGPGGRSTTAVATGDATVRHAPDRVYVTIAVESRAARPTPAQQQNAAAMTAVQAEAGGARPAEVGCRDDAGTTCSRNSTTRTASGRRRTFSPATRSGSPWTILSRVGAVVDAAVGAGATSVRGIQFDLKDRASVEREALRRAVADAKLNVEALATGAGMTVDRITRIDSAGSAPSPRPVNTALMRAAAPEAAQTPIVPGEIEIHAHVTLTAVLK